MFSHVMPNREEMESFNVNSQTKLAQTSPIAQHLKTANKRQSRPDYVVIEPLPSKRYKKDTFPHNKQRLLRTTEMLKESGLYDVAVRTAALIRENQQSHKDLENLKEETKLFLKDVLNNPENKKISQIFNGLQHSNAMYIAPLVLVNMSHISTLH
ncbi:putative uncharacterized serine-rich protein [Daphnia sinensis]|uniref:Uncharacterized serine-rich protein n=1 Tax=Daphnia sinensis TaxID=1820382 RepID=A0AAD5PZF5_9CRUS|nr:putative uncharacterized serine-rich protein [Daphnia sinensis]